MNVLIACEFTGTVRRAFAKAGHRAWSCDILPAEDGSPYHFQADIRAVLESAGAPMTWHGELVPSHWDLMVAHPPCTRLTNAGARWLHVPPPGRTLDEIWQELREGCDLYRYLRDAKVPRKAIENPVMHYHARELVKPAPRQTVQPWYYGDPFFKATGWELINLPRLQDTNRLTPPKRGTKEHKDWSRVHRESPGPNRAKNRSRFFPGMADAMAQQWGNAVELALAA